MLVLSRKVGQKVNIGFDIVVTVLEVKRKCARIGIEGPPTVPIHRSEIAERILNSLVMRSIDRFQEETDHL
jgi:carbon storage regulator